MAKDRESKSVPKVKLTKAEKKQLAKIIAQAKKPKHPQTTQKTIPYQRMWPDGICRVTDHYYTKTIQFYDINYQLAQNEDKEAIFEAWCDVLNYFSPSIRFQFSFVNLTALRESFARAIPLRSDQFESIQRELSKIIEVQQAKGNNGIVKTKYLTFGIDADNIRSAKPRLERIETDILNNFKRLGVAAEPMNGMERLRLLHGMLHMDEQEPFRFSWDWLAPSGLSVKDFIAPSSFEFRTGRSFGVGVKLLAAACGVDHDEGQQKHSLVAALQVLQQLLRLRAVGGKVRGDDVHVVSGADGLFLLLDGHFLQIRDLALDGLDGLDLIHGLDVHTDDEGAFHVEEVRQHPVVELRR